MSPEFRSTLNASSALIGLKDIKELPDKFTAFSPKLFFI
jgi:hypothetical protein